MNLNQRLLNMYGFRDAENDQGSNPELAAAQAAAAKVEAEAAAAAAAAAAAKAAKGGEGGSKPSDEEARLLKEAMKYKREAEAAREAAQAAAQKLKDFDGIDPAQVRKMIADQQAKELADAEKRGEYDRIIAQVRTEADNRLKAINDEKEALAKRLQEAHGLVDDLTIGSSFRGSKFLTENTVLTGDKARRLFGDHFEIEDGQVVAYDKPKGAKERTPLVDSRGEKLGFESAIEKILKADPDFEAIAKSKLRAGTGSTPQNVESKTQTTKVIPTGRHGLAAALRIKETKVDAKAK